REHGSDGAFIDRLVWVECVHPHTQDTPRLARPKIERTREIGRSPEHIRCAAVPKVIEVFEVFGQLLLCHHILTSICPAAIARIAQAQKALSMWPGSKKPVRKAVKHRNDLPPWRWRDVRRRGLGRCGAR